MRPGSPWLSARSPDLQEPPQQGHTLEMAQNITQHKQNHIHCCLEMYLMFLRSQWRGLSFQSHMFNKWNGKMNLLIQIDENTHRRCFILFLIALHQVLLIALGDPGNGCGLTCSFPSWLYPQSVVMLTSAQGR